MSSSNKSRSKSSKSSSSRTSKHVKSHPSPNLKEETIDGYSDFKARLILLEKEKPKEKVVFLFKGGLNDDGKEWCKICKFADKAVEECKAKYSPKGTLIKVTCGSINEWANHDNPFRKEPNKMAVSRLPTMIQWNTKKRLEGIDHMGPEQLRKMFDK